jgi:hypothetical protein
VYSSSFAPCLVKSLTPEQNFCFQKLSSFEDNIKGGSMSLSIAGRRIKFQQKMREANSLSSIDDELMQ